MDVLPACKNLLFRQRIKPRCRRVVFSDKISLYFIITLLCGISWNAAAELPATGAAVLNTKPDTNVVFAGDEKYQPYQFLDENRMPSGFDVELFRAVAGQVQMPIEVRLGNWDEHLKQLDTGEVDVMSMFVSVDRAQRFLFSKPYMSRYHLVFGHKRNAYAASLADLEGRRVAVQYGGLAWEALRSTADKAVIIPMNFEADALYAITRGEADYALVPLTIGYGAILDQNIKDVVALSPPLLQRDYAFAVTRSRPDLVQRINAALSAVQINGEQDRLYLKWLANLIPAGKSYRSGLMIGLWIALPLLVFTIVIFYWLRRANGNVDLYAARAVMEAKSRRDAEARAHYLAFHDTVTALPNRNRLEQTLSLIAWPGQNCALMRIDLLGTDMIYAIAGEHMIQQILLKIAGRLVSKYGKDRVADLGHGKFVVVFDEIGNVDAAKQAMQQVVDTIQQRFELDGLPLEQRCRVGLALYPAHAKSGAALLRSAEMACASAHEHGLSSQIYDVGLEPDARNLILLANLRDAIKNKKLGYGMQPKLDMASRQYVGAEMLVRWDHPKYGALPPDMFVPLAEKMGIIGQMTHYLILQALQHCREWQDLGLDFTFSVNVSGNDLADEALVNAIILQSGDLGHRLMLEVTETEIMRDTRRVLASVDLLRERGIRISLDDFGTGYSSFAYLQRLAPDELKIDRSFITNLLSSSSDRAIVSTTIRLAHDLNAKVIAEGIEDDATLECLAELGCDMGQGFVIARPMTVTDLMQSVLSQMPKIAND